MKEAHLWISDDGTQFETEIECTEYEFNQLINEARKSGMKFWNQYQEEIIPMWSKLDDIYFIYCPNETAIPIWDKITEDFWPYEACAIDRPDFYWYSEEADCWASIKTVRESLNNMEKTFGLRG